MSRQDEYSLVALDKFVEATRDSGYKSTINAVAELVDNALQALAEEVHVILDHDRARGDHPIEVVVADDGVGMDKRTLRQALRFGGSTRFNDREGLGRYGMGLPNASMSQARRLDVYTWQVGKRPIYSYLDIDEVIAGELRQVPPPRRQDLPKAVAENDFVSGTVIRWTRCDRLDHRRASTIARKLQTALGRIFRYYLWDGVRITVDGTPVEPVDPLYLAERSRTRGGNMFDEPLEFDIRPDGNVLAGAGRVTVTFSELPIHQWHGLTREEKRGLGVTNGAGVSVVRAGREIDYGWFFLGGKRRENYDDWWRCEIRFDPVLDEAFGITHTKQQIRPQEYLLQALAPEIEATAKALNGRVRRRHADLKAHRQAAIAEERAAVRDCELAPIPQQRRNNGQASFADELLKRHPELADDISSNGAVEYRIVEDDPSDTWFYRPLVRDGRVLLAVNRRHEFFRQWYSILQGEESPAGEHARYMLQMLLLAAARAEAFATRKPAREAIEEFRQAWSDALNVFLRK